MICLNRKPSKYAGLRFCFVYITMQIWLPFGYPIENIFGLIHIYTRIIVPWRALRRISVQLWCKVYISARGVTNARYAVSTEAVRPFCVFPRDFYSQIPAHTPIQSIDHIVVYNHVLLWFIGKQIWTVRVILIMNGSESCQKLGKFFGQRENTIRIGLSMSHDDEVIASLDWYLFFRDVDHTVIYIVPLKRGYLASTKTNKNLKLKRIGRNISGMISTLTTSCLDEVKSYMSGDCRDGIVYEHFLSRLTAL